MKVIIDCKIFEYEVVELIKAFGLLSTSGELIIREDKGELITTLSTEGKTSTQTSEIKLKNLKLQYKQAAYRIIAYNFNKKLPWGVLTGIRPVKLVNKIRNEYDGKITEKGLFDFLKNEYYIFDNKINDMLSISKIQNKIVDEFSISKGISIYIGIPFCPSRCNYCSFFSTDIKTSGKFVKPYISKLLEEIDLVKPYINDKHISSLYFGGGTPSALNSEDIAFLLKEVNKRFDFNIIDEVCFEAGRPDTLSRDKLLVIRSGGVRRISINPQTMNDNTLQKIGRNHNSKDIKDKFLVARELGFDNINMDIILGLEDESVTDVEYTMKEIKCLSPDSITIHTLSKKRASKLSEENFVFEDNDVVKQMKVARDYANEIKLVPYYLYRQKGIKGNLENLGLATIEKVSIYNIAIMEEIQSIIAFGAGGISKMVYPNENRIERVENVKSLEEYLKRNKEMADRKIQELIKEV